MLAAMFWEVGASSPVGNMISAQLLHLTVCISYPVHCLPGTSSMELILKPTLLQQQL